MREQPVTPTLPFEVDCPRCRVTHPIGTKHCIHCGGRVGRTRPAAELALAPAGAEPVEIEEAEELGRRGRGFSPFTFVWVVLALAGAMYRVCTPG